ncbi:aminodeoxychorismate lyase [Bacillus sp. BRMEA1]|nr:aminodeoxychorismate lyase [Neobacillus endophyticus]
MNLLSSFAAGLLIATTISGTVYLSSQGGSSKPVAKTTETEMKKILETNGYVVQTKADYDKTIANTKSVVSSAKQSADKPINSSKTATTVVVNVSQGMTSIDIGRMLVKANMIPNAFNFSQDIQKKGLEKNLKPGIFVVNSAMTYNQVISTIFKK